MFHDLNLLAFLIDQRYVDNTRGRFHAPLANTTELLEPFHHADETVADCLLVGSYFLVAIQKQRGMVAYAKVGDEVFC